MRRPLVSLSLLLVLALVGTAFAGLSGTDRKKLSRSAGKWLDPSLGEEDRQEGRETFLGWFKSKKIKELKDVEAMSDILANAGKRAGRFKGVQSIEIESREEKLGGIKFKALVSVPKGYKGDGEPYPMIYCVPDKGQTAEKHMDEYWLSPTIRNSFIIVVLDFMYDKVAEVKKETEKDEDGRVTFVEKKVMKDFTWGHLRAQAQFWETLLNVLTRQLKVDPNRIIVDGAGMGSTGALIMTVGQPWRFAGLIVRGGEYEGANLSNMAHLKVLTMPLATAPEGAAKTAAKLKEICGKNYKAGENSPKWSGAKEEGTEMLAWLNACVRDRYPVPCTWTHTDNTDLVGYWFFIKQRFDPEKPAKMTIEAKNGEVIVKSENVKLFDLFLNDKLVNLEKPFKLKINEEEAREVEVKRDPKELLGHALAGPGGKPPFDLGCVFVAEVENIYPIPPADGEKEDGDKKDDAKKDGDKKDGDKKDNEKKDDTKKDGK